MILPMKRFRIAGPKSAAHQLVKRLHDFGCFHVTSPQRDPLLREGGLSIGVFSEEAAEKLTRMENLSAELEAALAVLPKESGPDRAARLLSLSGKEWTSEATQGEIRSTVEEILSVSRQMDEILGNLKEITQYRNLYEEFLPLIEMVVSSASVEMTGITFPKEFESAYEELEEAMEKVTEGAFSILKSESGEMGRSALLIYPASLHEKVMARVIGKKARPVRLPERYSGDTFAATLKCLFEKEREFRAELERLRRRMERLSLDRSTLLHAAREGLALAAAPLKAQHLLAHSAHVFWLSGWVPENEAETLRKKLGEEFRDATLIFSESPARAEYEETPVKLKNFFWARPFERLLHLYSLPQYHTADPTVIMAVTFPLFFGMMLGDVGYAAFLAAIGYALKRRFPALQMAKDVSSVIFLCAATSAVFGTIYGEFFGGLWLQLGLPHPLFDRKEETVPMLYTVLLMGCLHVTLGAAMGAWNGIKLGSLRTALEKCGDVLLLPSLVWIAFRMESDLPPGWRLALPLAALFLKLCSGKIMETVTELPRLVSSVLSYSRLMALGLASVIMADLANDMPTSGAWLLPSLLVAVSMHALNFVIGVLSPSIQAVRLHYVEFFSQFYAPRGVPFSPLQKETGVS